jgi:hypothetical protein
VLSLKSRDFVLGARAVGSGPLRIAFIHLLPNVVAPLAQDAALRLGDLILVEAALSFLGLGVQPPLASWGGMVAQGEELVMGGWWVSLFPGACIAATVIARVPASPPPSSPRRSSPTGSATWRAPSGTRDETAPGVVKCPRSTARSASRTPES